jgi:enoyl-CoA hydratase/carnithine racemase
MTNDDLVLLEVHDGVAVVTLNRPERLNAWTPELQTRYHDLLDECAARADVRAVVVTGAGRGFCAGADMAVLSGLSNGAGATAPAFPGERNGQDERPVRHPLSIPKPLIAAVNGPCAGIGLVMALMCDIRFAAADAKITTSFSRRGLVAEHGISWILPRLVGPANALELLFSSRVLLGAEAAELGLVNRAFESDVLGESVTYAGMLARECSPASLATMKRQIYADLSRDLPEAVDEASRLMAESFTRLDFAEGVASFLEHRPPHFAPLAG